MLWWALNTCAEKGGHSRWLVFLSLRCCLSTFVGMKDFEASGKTADCF